MWKSYKTVLDSWDGLEDDAKEEITDVIAPSLTSAMLKDIFGAYAVYDKAKEMNHPIRKHETYWAVKAFMEVMVDVIREDGYLRIYDILILERKWKNAKTYGNFGRGVVRKEGKYVPSIRFGKRMNRVAQEKADEGEEEVE